MRGCSQQEESGTDSSRNRNWRRESRDVDDSSNARDTDR